MVPDGPSAFVRRHGGRLRRNVNRRRRNVIRALDISDPDHLTPSPVFVLSPVRSGSTLLRLILDTHTKVCAPHELHLRTLTVTTDRKHAIRAISAVGLSDEDLANVLWDRMLNRELDRSGKLIVVDKTPQNAESWERIHAFWPRARYIHLRRHPGSIVRSMSEARPDVATERHVRRVLQYGEHLNRARAVLPGPTVRYEELTTAPESVVRDLCSYLGVRYQPRMLHYGRKRKHGYPAGLGDWGDTVRTGRIQTGRAVPAPQDIPAALHELCADWGYF